jgi:calcium/calmodulin-dependent protein kinase (CaM kinase) II
LAIPVPLFEENTIMSAAAESELLDLSRRLLKAIDAGDWSSYAELCDEQITCFEPEAEGHLVVGLPFHKFYFDLPGSGSPRQSSMAAAHVRVIGDMGIVCYARVVQKLDSSGAPVTACADETRVWQRINGKWKHVHFHRSPC